MRASRFVRRPVRGVVAAPVPFAVVLTVAVTVALAAVLSGCQGARSNPGAVAAASGATTTSGAHATVVVARSARPARRCATADLSVAPASRMVKQGLDIERFTVTTAAPDGCTLAGAPGLRPTGLLSPQSPGATVDLAVSQQPMPDDVGLRTGDGGGTVPLAPGGAASFYLAWYGTSSVVCVQGDGFGFNAPGDSSYDDMKPVQYALGPVCNGLFYVSPVF